MHSSCFFLKQGYLSGHFDEKGSVFLERYDSNIVVKLIGYGILLKNTKDR